MIIPTKLQKGDEIRVLAPSSSSARLTNYGMDRAKERLEDLGYHVTYGKYIKEVAEIGSSSIQSRVADLHEAFSSPNVKAVLTANRRV